MATEISRHRMTAEGAVRSCFGHAVRAPFDEQELAYFDEAELQRRAGLDCGDLQFIWCGSPRALFSEGLLEVENSLGAVPRIPEDGGWLRPGMLYCGCRICRFGQNMTSRLAPFAFVRTVAPPVQIGLGKRLPGVLDRPAASVADLQLAALADALDIPKAESQNSPTQSPDDRVISVASVTSGCFIDDRAVAAAKADALEAIQAFAKQTTERSSSWLTDPWHGVTAHKNDGGGSVGYQLFPIPEAKPTLAIQGLPFGDRWTGSNRLATGGSDKTAAWRSSYAELVENASWWVFIPPYVLLTDPPSVVGQEGIGLTASSAGSAIAYPDGWSVDWPDVKQSPEWAAVTSEDQPVESSDRIVTWEEFLAEPRGEMRQEMVAALAPDRPDQGRCIAQDRFGELWSVEDMKLVRVVDATPKDDGPAIYWLSVPRTMTSVREAVAWTFGMAKYEYQPDVET